MTTNPTTPRYLPEPQHAAWAARAALAIARRDQAGMHLLLEQVEKADGVNELVFALASGYATYFEASDKVDALATVAEQLQAAANAAETEKKKDDDGE